MATDYELKEVFDISKFTIVGSPTITDEGILSDVPSNGYLLSNSTISIDSTGIFSLKGKIFCYNSSNIGTYLNLYGGSTYKNIIIRSVQNTNQSQLVVNANGTNQVLTTISSTAGWNDIEVGYNGTNYYYVLNGTKTELTTATTKPDSGSYYLYAGNRGDSLSNNNLSGNRQLDLSSVHINVDGQEVFKGTKTVVAKIPPDIISGKSIPVDYQSMLDELQDYYANLLIIQYHNKPKAIALIKNLVKHLFADMILFKIRDGFNIVNEPFAIGKQLDCIGKWVGVNRIYDAGQPLYPWFSYVDWEQTTTDQYQGGFQDWNDPIAEDGGFLGFDDLIMGANKTALADDLFLALIKMKIIKNSSTHTMGDLDKKFYEYFGDQLYLTWDGINLTYNYQNSLAAVIEVAKVKNALPIPNGMVVSFNAL